MYYLDDYSLCGLFERYLGTQMKMPYLTAVAHRANIDRISEFLMLRYSLGLQRKEDIQQMTGDMFEAWVAHENMLGTSQEQLLLMCSELMCFFDYLMEKENITKVPWRRIVPTLEYLENEKTKQDNGKYNPERDFLGYYEGAALTEGIANKYAKTFRHYENARKSNGYERYWNVYCVNAEEYDDGAILFRDIRFIEQKLILSGEERMRMMEIIREEELDEYTVDDSRENMYILHDLNGSKPTFIMIPANNNVTYYYKKESDI